MTASTGSAEPAARRWRASSLWNLVFLGYLVFGVLFRTGSLVLNLTVTIASVVVFLGVYALVELGRATGQWPAPATAALGLAVVPINGSATVFFVYAVAFAAVLSPRSAAVWWMIAATGLLAVSCLISPVPLPYLWLSVLPTGISVWIVGLSILDQHQRERDLRVHNARVEHLATLSERERIARDLHDLLGQTLTGIVVRSQLARRLTAHDAEAGAAEMAEVERLARDALTEVRATVSGWRQVSVDDELTAARDALTAAGVEMSEHRDPDLQLTPSAETALAMALREAVTNVVRHAHATRCTVALREVGGRVVLEVADDGVGGGAREGNGLTGMRERIAALGGDVQRKARDGTALVVALPAAVAT